MSGPWWDMSRYPDVDPDTVLTPEQHTLIGTALAVDDVSLSDAVWEHMITVALGADTGSGADGEPETTEATETTEDGAFALDPSTGSADPSDEHVVGWDGGPDGTDPDHPDDPSVPVWGGSEPA